MIVYSLEGTNPQLIKRSNGLSFCPGFAKDQTDNIWVTLLTVNPNPIHFDAHYAAQTSFGRPLVDATFTLALVTGLSVSDISQNGINLGWDEVRLPAPVYEGDTIYAQSELLSKRESKSHPDRGIIQVKTISYNQESTVVLTFKRTIMIYKAGHVLNIPKPDIKLDSAD